MSEEQIIKYINPLGPVFFCGFTLGFSVGGLFVTLCWKFI